MATTFADTESIIEGGKVNNMTSEDILKVVNLKHAWEFILNKNVVLSDTNFALLCEISCDLTCHLNFELFKSLLKS